MYIPICTWLSHYRKQFSFNNSFEIPRGNQNEILYHTGLLRLIEKILQSFETFYRGAEKYLKGENLR